VCYVDDFLDMDGSIYLDPHEQGRNLEHHFHLDIDFRYIQRGLNIITWT